MCPQRLHDLDLFGRSFASIVKVLIQADELDLVPTDPNAKPQPTTREFIERGGLLCHQYRLALRQDEHAGGESDLFCAAGKKPKQHKWVVIGVFGRADSLIVLIERSRPTPIGSLADTKHAAQAVDGEFCFRPIDEREPHRLPSRAKKAVAFFRMSRSWRRISFSRRSRLNSAVTSLSAAAGSTARRSRLRPIQRTSVDSPIPRSPAISRWVRPLVCTRRTASSSNSFVNRRCCVIEFLIAHGELSTFPKQVHSDCSFRGDIAVQAGIAGASHQRERECLVRCPAWMLRGAESAQPRKEATL